MGIFNTKEEFCNLCQKTGHNRDSHTNCGYCLDNHKTNEHLCEKCGLLGHNYSKHCEYCDKLHLKYDHKCTICGIDGHQQNEEDHIKCYVCDVNNYGDIKYTHHTIGHISSIGIMNISLKERESFKYCEYCCRINYTENNKCIICSEYIPEKVKCSRERCGYHKDNSIEKHCPYCGCKFTHF
jgi:hypothetical protein